MVATPKRNVSSLKIKYENFLKYIIHCNSFPFRFLVKKLVNNNDLVVLFNEY